MSLPPVGALERVIADADQTRVGAWRIDFSSDEIWWSPEMFAMFGLDPAFPAPGLRDIDAMLDPGTAERLWQRRLRMRAEPHSFVEIFWLTRADGDRRLLDMHGWRVDAGTGPVRAMFGTCRDITGAAAQRAVQEGLSRRQATILDAAGDGICGLDLEGRVTFTNPALLRLMRREGEQLVGRPLHELVHRDADGRESHRACDCPFQVGERRPAGATDPGFRRADGSRIEVGYVLVGFDEVSERGAVVSLRDITARRAAARLLQSSLRQVQTLSAQRGALLGHLAEAEERERMRIAADIHDDTIQALGAVALRLATAGERARGDAERDLFVDSELEVRGVAERLRRLMFELMAPDDAGDLRTAVATYCAVLFAGTGIRFELDGDIGEVATDRALIAYRLIQEALRNARAHSRGTRVHVSMCERDGEHIFRISDDGVGMGDPTTPPTHAGLRIVRRRVEAAGGSARVSVGLEGRGSCIELRLPSVEGAPR